jgi:hypothetical protein
LNLTFQFVKFKLVKRVQTPFGWWSTLIQQRNLMFKNNIVSLHRKFWLTKHFRKLPFQACQLSISKLTKVAMLYCHVTITTMSMTVSKMQLLLPINKLFKSASQRNTHAFTSAVRIPKALFALQTFVQLLWLDPLILYKVFVTTMVTVLLNNVQTMLFG